MTDPKDHDENILDRITQHWRETEVPDAPPEHVTDAILRKIASAGHETIRTLPLNERILTMIWKIRYPSAAAATMILAATIAWFLFSGTQAFAFEEVIENIRKIRTTTFSMVSQIGDNPPSPPGRGYFMAPGRIRIELPDGPVMIFNYLDEKGLSLLPDQKIAMVIDFKGMPADRKQAMLNSTFVDPLANANPDQVKFLRQEKIDGKATKVFSLSQPGNQNTVWVDVESQLPVRFESMTELAGGQRQRNVITDIQWNIDLEDSLFTTDAPEGYALQDAQSIDFSEPTEQELIEVFRVWLEVSDNEFPKRFSADTIFGDFGLLYQKKNEKGPEALKKFLDLQKTIQRSAIFIMYIQQSEGEWHYTGSGVKLGEADKVVAYWKSKQDAPTYRVLYGDLSIKDVKPDDLPADVRK